MNPTLEAKGRIAQAMQMAGFHTASLAMSAGEVFVENLKLCETQWAEYITSQGNRFFDHQEKVWYAAKKVLTPKAI